MIGPLTKEQFRTAIITTRGSIITDDIGLIDLEEDLQMELVHVSDHLHIPFIVKNLTQQAFDTFFYKGRSGRGTLYNYIDCIEEGSTEDSHLRSLITNNHILHVFKQAHEKSVYLNTIYNSLHLLSDTPYQLMCDIIQEVPVMKDFLHKQQVYIEGKRKHNLESLGI